MRCAAFEAPYMDKFEAPTVEGIDFPSLGLYQAWNDTESGTLYVGTYPITPDRQGIETTWRVTNLPNTEDVFILCDGEPFERFAVTGDGTIRLDTTIDTRQYQIFTGYRGPDGPPVARREEPRDRRGAAGLAASRPSADNALAGARRASSKLVPGGGPTCPCWPPSKTGLRPKGPLSAGQVHVAKTLILLWWMWGKRVRNNVARRNWFRVWRPALRPTVARDFR